MDARPCAERNHRSPRTLAPPSLSLSKNYQGYGATYTTLATLCGQLDKSFKNLGKPCLRSLTQPYRTTAQAGGGATENREAYPTGCLAAGSRIDAHPSGSHHFPHSTGAGATVSRLHGAARAGALHFPHRLPPAFLLCAP